MNEFMTAETLATFAGLTVAVGLIVQFTKSVVKKQFGDASVRLYTFGVSLILTFVFAPCWTRCARCSSYYYKRCIGMHGKHGGL